MYQGSDCGTPMAKGPSSGERGRLLRVMFPCTAVLRVEGVQSHGFSAIDAIGVIA